MPRREDDALVSPYLSDSYYEMARSLDHDMSCPICLESLMCCKSCFCLLKCGHALHVRCFLQMQDRSRCPVCRAA